MKKRFVLLSAAVGAVLLSGCVSSNRMARMSSGVFGEYSAPPKYRLRSEKFQKKTPHADSVKRSNKTDIAGVNDTLINVWPFFFRNAAYWSILWPFIDCDDYGFAVRPFYVQDGDEHSVLFPFASWNTVDKDGWVANVVWTKEGAFGFVPFTWQNTKKDHGWFYYTPLFIHNYDNRPFKFNERSGYLGDSKTSRDDYFTEFMLAYWSKNTVLDSGKWRWLFFNMSKAEKAYQFAKIGKAVPNDTELMKFKKSVFDTFPQKEGYSFGFFPLFHYEKYPLDGVNCQILLLNGYMRRKYKLEWAFFAPLLSYENNELDNERLWMSADEEFFSLPLLTKITKTKRFVNTGAVKTLRKLETLNRRKSFQQNLPLIKDLLKELDPSLQLPKTVVDYDTLNLFLNDWKKGKKFPVEYVYKGGCLPLFLYDVNGNTRSYTFPALLSQYKKSSNYVSFWSLPILTCMNKSEYRDYLRIAAPFVYMDSWKRNKEAHTKRIHSSDTKMARTWDVVEEKDIYAACGLFYRGKIAFHVAKKGFNGSDLEFLRKNILQQYHTRRNIQTRWENHKREVARAAAWGPKNKIDYYKKCIREEELKIEAEQIRKQERDVEAKWKLIVQTAGKIKFQIAEKDIESEEAANETVNRLIAHYTELRWKEDIGNGFFFRKEKFYNGDYNWRLLFFLANGEKVGAKESTNVLHLLYRHRRDGNRSETLFFPFVSIVEDGADSKVSFLWRVFQLKKEKGKTGGYFLFIPF